MSTLFARAARRASIKLSYTDGFSPRAKISFGPELPAGVVALNEPVDLWVNPEEDSAAAKLLQEKMKNGYSGSIVEALNAQMPEGFNVKKCIFPAAGAPALGKECKAAHYLLWSRNKLLMEGGAAGLLSHMERYYGEAVLNGLVEFDDFTRISVVLEGPAQNGIGGWVKTLTADGVIAGWFEMCVVRVSLGRWNGKQMEPIGGDAARAFI